MRVKRFNQGGYVIHGIRGGFVGKVSAWYDADGRLIDAEQFVGRASRPVKLNGPIWRVLATIRPR